MKTKIERALWWVSIVIATSIALAIPPSYFSDDAKLVIVAVGAATVTWFVVKVLIVIARS